MTDQVLTQAAGGVLTVTFNRPQKKNAFTLRMYEQLVLALREADRDPEVRVILLTGAGDAFTSGNDLADFMSDPPKGEDSPVFQLLLALVEVKKPLIAMVNGAAVGIGTTMLLHCDLVYASDRAKLVMPFVNLGLVPEGGSTYLLPRMAGHARAAELLLFGEPFDARVAQEVGIVNEVFEADALEAAVRARAQKLAEKPPLALERTKRLLKEPIRNGVLRAIRDEGDLFVRSLSSPEAAEAFSAFFEKRRPDFSKLPRE